ncbi:MAG: DedA family protein [Deltaproteobacteria bacterium]|nr:DedA family protein [Deltaproteobacteria bacterium]MBI3391288.1 DedA family protein [Deltaproteobacteria bacterium]
MEDFLVRYGLLAVFAGVALEGDVCALLAGVVAHLGFFSLSTAIVTTCAGALTADWMWYGVGRSRAAAMRDSAIYRRVGPFIERLAQRIGVWEVTGARFVFGARVPSMLFWGMNRLPFGRFIALDFLGCALWSTVFVAAGFMFSGSAAMLLGNMKRAEHWLLAALLVTATAVLLIRRAMRSRLRRESTALRS